LIKEGILAKLKNYLTLSSANFGSAVITAMFWIYLASLLDKSEYGTLGYLISIATVAHVVSSIGLGKTIVVYGAKKENVLSPAYTLGLISSSFASIVVYIITQNVSVSFLTWGMMVFLLKISDINSKGFYLAFTKYRILRSSLAVILGLVLYQILGINGIVLGFALATLPALGGLYNYVKNKKGSITLLKSKRKFMVNAWLLRLGDMLFWWGDKLIIGLVFGFSVLGSYLLAAQYLLLLNTIPSALVIYLLPKESQGKSNKTIKILSVGVSCILVLVSVSVVPHAIDAFFPDYQESILPAQIMSIAIIPITIYAIFESQFIGKEMPRIPLIATGLQTITYLSLIILVGTEFGIIGIAVAFLISTVMRASFNTIITSIYR